MNVIKSSVNAGRVVARSGQFFKVVSINNYKHKRVLFLQDMKTNDHTIKEYDDFIKDDEWEVLDEDPVAKEDRKVIADGINQGLESTAADLKIGFFIIVIGTGSLVVYGGFDILYKN